MTALLCAAVVAASTVMAPGVVMAEETEAVTEAVTEASTEAATEADTEALTEASTEEALELAERPDYKALDYVELGEYKGLTVEVEPTAVSDDEVLKQIRANAGSDILEMTLTEGARRGRRYRQILIMKESWTARHLKAVRQRIRIWKSVPVHLFRASRMDW